MIIVNESVNLKFKENSHNYYGVKAMNSSQKMTGKCSWACHNNTNFCKENHVKFVKNHFELIDPIYFGIINRLRGTGNYALANILILVILMPLLMWFLIVKSLNIQSKINELKRN